MKIEKDKKKNAGMYGYDTSSTDREFQNYGVALPWLIADEQRKKMEVLLKRNVTSPTNTDGCLVFLIVGTA